MPDKYWEYLRLNDTDRSKVHFIPTAPNGDKLGGVSVSEKATWDGKYAKPADGIPSTDMASAVQTSLGKADSALQSVKTINNQSITGTGNLNVPMGGDIIQDEDESNCGVVVSGTLANVDATLTVSGDAADAKIVGDSISNINQALGEKQDTLIAGTNITIAADGKTISATGAGGGIPEAPTDGKTYGRKSAAWDDLNKRYELIEIICLGYTLTELEPEDWSTNWTDYYTKNLSVPNNPRFTQVTGGSAPTWQANKYYAFDNTDIASLTRNQTPNGDAYCYKNVMIIITHPKGKVWQKVCVHGHNVSYPFISGYVSNDTVGNYVSRYIINCDGGYMNGSRVEFTSSPNALNYTPYLSTIDYDYSIQNVDTITWFTIYTIKAGSIIRIYGRK